MRVLQVATFAHPDHAGGAERVVGEVARVLAERGHDVDLLTGVWGPPPLEEKIGSLRIHRYALSREAFWRSAWTGVRRLLASGVGADADVVHLHQTASALPAVFGRGRGAPPRLLSFYAPYWLEFLARHRDGRARGRVPLKARLLAKALRRADSYLLDRSDAVLVLSDFSRAQVAELRPAMGPTCLASTGGVDTRLFRPARDADERLATRRRLGLHTELPMVLSVRRLVPRMGLADLVEAVSRLRSPVQLVIAGQGPERARLEQRIREHGLSERTHLLGRVEDDELPALYAAADVFALPTRSLEGFGLVTAEALASGLPVVATRVGATAEWLRDDAFARLVPPEDPGALAAALEAWLENAPARVRAGAAARAHAEAALGWEHHVDHVEAALRALVEARS